MVEAIRVDVRYQEVTNFFKRLTVKVPPMSAQIGLDFCNLTANTMKRKLLAKKNVWRQKLLRGIKANMVSKYRQNVTMNKAGVWLDRMKPHHVQLKKGRLIYQWALQKGNENVRKIAARQGMIFVRPHPFVDDSFAESFSKLNKIIKYRLDKVIK